MTELGRRIDALAQKKRISRMALARACGEKPVSFNRTLTDHHLQARIMPILAKELEVSLDYLLTGEEEATIPVVINAKALGRILGLAERGRDQAPAA